LVLTLRRMALSIGDTVAISQAVHGIVIVASVIFWVLKTRNGAWPANGDIAHNKTSPVSIDPSVRRLNKVEIVLARAVLATRTSNAYRLSGPQGPRISSQLAFITSIVAPVSARRFATSRKTLPTIPANSIGNIVWPNLAASNMCAGRVHRFCAVASYDSAPEAEDPFGYIKMLGYTSLP
jgi:hypothetical protein